MSVNSAVAHGIILALGLIMPLGIQNIFIFNQGASHRHFWKAMPSVVTAGICDMVMIVLAVFGVSLLILEIAWLKLVIFSVGFVFLMTMGWFSWRASHENMSLEKHAYSYKKQIIVGISVSILNPHALIDTALVIGTSALHYEGIERVAYTFGCIVATWFWFLGLCYAGYQLQKLESASLWLSRMNKLGALFMWGVALYLGWNIVQQTKIF